MSGAAPIKGMDRVVEVWGRWSRRRGGLGEVVLVRKGCIGRQRPWHSVVVVGGVGGGRSGGRGS